MPETLSVHETQLHDDVPIVVYSGEDLQLPLWSEVPNLFLDRLRIAAAPEIDQAHFTFHYGVAGGMLAPETTAPDFGTVAPLQLNGKYCKVVFDPEGETTDDGQPLLTWYGIFEIDLKQVQGSSGEDSTGVQRITAYGLLRMLERQIVRTAVVADGSSTKRIARGLAFNRESGGRIARGENRTLEPDLDGFHVFSSAPRDSGAAWTATDAISHLLRFHRPHRLLENLDEDPTSVVTFHNAGSNLDVDWYKISVPTDGRSVKAILDDLINRRRGVGYYVRYDEDSATVLLHTFNYFDFQPPADSPITLEANPKVYTLDFETGFNVERAVVLDSIHTRFHRVVVLGERKTSTASFSFEESALQIGGDWTSDDETLYANAAAGDAGSDERTAYDALDPAERELKNAQFRADDRMRHVFRRFRVVDGWNQRLSDLDPDTEDFDEYWLAPVLDADGNASATLLASSVGEALWHSGARFLDVLPLLERHDYGGSAIADGTTAADYAGDGQPEYRRPFVFVRMTDDISPIDLPDGERWELLNSAASAQFEDSVRDWAVDLELADSEPAFLLHVRPPNRSQTMLVEGGPTETVDDWYAVPDDASHPDLQGGVKYTNLRLTATLELDARLEVSRTIAPPAAGEQDRELFIEVPDARLDYVVPNTFVEIRGGAFVASEGGFARDDRARLEQIAYMAAEWYGRDRQSLSLVINGLFSGFDLGYLIADIGAVYNRQEVNLPITAVTYQTARAPMQQTIETSYAALDFVL